MKDVLICLPIYGNPIYDCVMACEDAKRNPQNPVKGVLTYRGDSLVSRARNELARLFLASDCKYMMFVDDDLEFHPDMIARLRSHNLPIVGGVYYKKSLDFSPVLNRPVANHDNGLTEVGEIGTGFLMIRRDVFGAMKEYFDIEYSPAQDQPPGPRWDFFPVGRKHGDKTGQYLSEDYYFCQRATELGYKIYADTQVVPLHHGKAVYPPSHADMTNGLVRAFESMGVSKPVDEKLVLEAINTLQQHRDKYHDMDSRIEVIKKPQGDEPAKG
jgi:hypothetical protein